MGMGPDPLGGVLTGGVLTGGVLTPERERGQAALGRGPRPVAPTVEFTSGLRLTRAAGYRYFRGSREAECGNQPRPRG